MKRNPQRFAQPGDGPELELDVACLDSPEVADIHPQRVCQILLRPAPPIAELGDALAEASLQIVERRVLHHPARERLGGRVETRVLGHPRFTGGAPFTVLFVRFRSI